MVGKLLNQGGTGSALATMAEYQKWSEFFNKSQLGIPELPRVGVKNLPNSEGAEKFVAGETVVEEGVFWRCLEGVEVGGKEVSCCCSCCCRR